MVGEVTRPQTWIQLVTEGPLCARTCIRCWDTDQTPILMMLKLDWEETDKKKLKYIVHQKMISTVKKTVK